MLFVFILWSVLFTVFVLGPVLQSQKAREQEALVHTYRHFQLEILRSRYPALREMTDREIMQEYDVDRIFWRV